MYTPVNPSFTISKWGLRGSELYRHVFVMRNKKNNVYSCKPQFYYIKMGFKGVNIILTCFPLRKHAYSTILEILPPKNENFQIKISDIFHISAQNIDCGYSLEPPRRGGSNEYPQSTILSRYKKNNVYPVNPSFTI